MARKWGVFLNSVFFVLGFSLVFSVVGILLQSVLLHVSFVVQKWLAYSGGVVIIIFGVYLLGLLKLPFLDRQRIFRVRRFRFSYLTSFVFGAAFALGWTPCIGAVLGGILTLAIVHPAGAFGLLLAYSLGLGVPFLLGGIFTQQLSLFIGRFGSRLRHVNRAFGALLVAVGLLVVTNRMGVVANFGFLRDWLFSIDAATAHGALSLNYGIAFVAGLGSFLSPCILPLIPGFLAYLASTAVSDEGV